MGIVVRQSIKATVVNYVGILLGFVTTMFVLTKYLPVEDVGLRSVLFEAAVLVATLSQLGASVSVLRFFPYFKNKNNGHNGFFFYVIMLPLVGCVVFIPLYLLFKEPIIAFFSKSSTLFTPYFYWIIPLIIFLAYWGVFEAYSTANKRIVVPKLIREVVVRVLLVGVFVLYGWHVVGRDGFVATFIAVYAVAMLLMLFYVSRISSVSLRHDLFGVPSALRKDMLRYTLICIVSALGSTILSKVDLFMLSSGMGFGAAGIYTIASYVGTVIEVPSRAINPISSPVASEAMSSGDMAAAEQLYKKVSLTEFIASGFLFVLIWSNIDNLFDVMPNGEVYREGKWVVFFIGISKMVTAVFSFGSTLIGFSRYYYWTVSFVFVLAAMGILSNYFLIPLFGLSGAAIATLLTCCLSCAFQQWIVLLKIKSNPFSWGTLKMVVVVLVLLGINALLPRLGNCWVDAACRTIVVGGTGIAAIYFGKVSDDVNALIRTVLSKVFRRQSDRQA